MFGSKYEKELRQMIADYKAKYGMPHFDPRFQPRFETGSAGLPEGMPLTGDPYLDELLLEESGGKTGVNFNKDAVEAYTRIGQSAISAMSIIEDLKVSQLIWKEEHHFFEGAQDYTLLCAALLLWCRKKGPKEAFVHQRKLQEWNNEFFDNDSQITLFPYWVACDMDSRRLQREWSDFYEKEAAWYNTH